LSEKSEPSARGIESRFRDLSVDVRKERLVRYIVRQVESGRHVDDILGDPYVVAHSDYFSPDRILQDPRVIKGIEEQIRRQFADYGETVGGAEASGGDELSSDASADEGTTDA
jgi:hypothetical protein